MLEMVYKSKVVAQYVPIGVTYQSQYCPMILIIDDVMFDVWFLVSINGITKYIEIPPKQSKSHYAT